MSTSGSTAKVENKFACEFCQKDFARESSLAVHMCEPKRRRQEKSERGVELGFQSYLKFYETMQGSSRLKTFDDFADSAYYRAFVKFGRYCVNVRAINPSRFVEWLLKHNKKLDRWASDQIYTEYLVDHLKAEHVDDALARAMEFAIDWADKNSAADRDCLRYGNINIICHAVTSGRISPWVLYNCTSGNEFLHKLNQEQTSMIWTWIDPDFWSKKLKDYPADTEYVREILNKAGW